MTKQEIIGKATAMLLAHGLRVEWQEESGWKLQVKVRPRRSDSHELNAAFDMAQVETCQLREVFVSKIVDGIVHQFRAAGVTNDNKKGEGDAQS